MRSLTVSKTTTQPEAVPSPSPPPNAITTACALAWFRHQNEGGALDLAVAVEAGSANIVAVDEDRTELVVGESVISRPKRR